MKKLAAFLMVLMLCIPACAGASAPFYAASSEFQWHMSYMCEQYIDWQMINAEGEKSLLWGYGETLPELFLIEDRYDTLHEVYVSAFLPTSYHQAAKVMENLVKTADLASETIFLLEDGGFSADIGAMNQNSLYTVLNDVNRARSMDMLMGEPVYLQQHVLDYYYTHEIEYDMFEDAIYYRITITHD